MVDNNSKHSRSRCPETRHAVPLSKAHSDGQQVSWLLETMLSSARSRLPTLGLRKRASWDSVCRAIIEESLAKGRAYRRRRELDELLASYHPLSVECILRLCVRKAVQESAHDYMQLPTGHGGEVADSRAVFGFFAAIEKPANCNAAELEALKSTASRESQAKRTSRRG